MRFLVDECTGSRVSVFLRELGYEVFSVFDESRGISDDQILTKALSEDWILVTNDKDFGEMIFRENRKHSGVIFLRLEDERPANKIAVMTKFLESHKERIAKNFIVVTETKVKFSNI